jgi:predicted metal-dependent HD superfamily phosphohydrolase
VNANFLDHRHLGLLPARAAGLTGRQVDDVLCFYDEPHRHYHNRVHLREMFDVAQQLALDLTPVQSLAILFHDAVYVPGAPRGANEGLSAQLLRLYAANLDASLVDRAAGVVIDTADHVAHSDEAEAVLDLDLLRLAVPPPDFERYSREVFAEQRPLIPLADEGQAWRYFEERRAPFFERLLDRDAIYGLPVFYDRFEERARENLRRELARFKARGVQSSG